MRFIKRLKSIVLHMIQVDTRTSVLGLKHILHLANILEENSSKLSQSMQKEEMP